MKCWWFLCEHYFRFITCIAIALRAVYEDNSVPLKYEDRFLEMRIVIIKISRSLDRLIFIIGIPLLVIWRIYIEAIPSTPLTPHLPSITRFREPFNGRIVTGISPLWPLLLTWINFNPWISNYIHYNVWDEIIYPFLNFNGATVEVYEWISNFIPHITGHVLTYSCRDSS